MPLPVIYSILYRPSVQYRKKVYFMGVSKKYDERLNQIMDVAESLFVSKGYEKTTVNDILNGVGIGKGTFYHYFQSKEEVMNAVIIRMVNKIKQIARAIAEKPDLSADQKFHQILTAMNMRDDKNAELIKELHHMDSGAMHQKSITESILAVSPILSDVIKQGIAEGIYNTPYPEESVEFLFTAIQFLLDPGIFRWTQKEILQKVNAFVYIMELALGSAKGSFDYMIEMYEESLQNPE